MSRGKFTIKTAGRQQISLNRASNSLIVKKKEGNQTVNDAKFL